MRSSAKRKRMFGGDFSFATVEERPPLIARIAKLRRVSQRNMSSFQVVMDAAVSLRVDRQYQAAEAGTSGMGVTKLELGNEENRA